jgi:hypothetical protein
MTQVPVIDAFWLSGIVCQHILYHIADEMYDICRVTNVKRMKSILLSKEKLCPYIHENLEHHGSPWKLTIANTSGGGGE